MGTHISPRRVCGTPGPRTESTTSSARNIWRGTCDPKVVTLSGRIMSTPIYV